jgi:hypothetical protein
MSMKNKALKNSLLKSLSPCATTFDKESISKLEQEIASFEEELRNAESKVHSIKSQIQARYHNEIARIHELYSLYKNQKRLKKEKRLEQKKRGKNYKEPTGLKLSAKGKSTDSNNKSESSHELKRLYREAVVQVHPDKFINHPAQISKRSLELTIQLIDVYQSGDLEKLKLAHRHIMSGNAMAGFQEDTSNVPDPVAMKKYLVQKRDTLVSELNQVKKSYFYQIFSTSDNISDIIDSMASQFRLRIQQLERRTRS